MKYKSGGADLLTAFPSPLISYSPEMTENIMVLMLSSEKRAMFSFCERLLSTIIVTKKRTVISLCITAVIFSIFQTSELTILAAIFPDASGFPIIFLSSAYFFTILSL